MQKSLKTAVLVTPRFGGEELHFELALASEGYAVRRYPYDESQFRTKSLAKRVLAIALNLIGMRRVSKGLGWNVKAYDTFLRQCIAAEVDLILVVKPFLVSSTLCRELERRREDVRFFTYDTLKRFPINRQVIQSGRLITFDPHDAIRKEIKFSPIPRIGDVGRAKYPMPTEGDNERHKVKFTFAGAFSFFRFSRLLVFNLVLRLNKIESEFYLKINGLNTEIRILNIGFVGRYVEFAEEEGVIPIDIPQSHQESGSARSHDLTRLVFSYDWKTPQWRHLNIRSLFATAVSAARVSRLVRSKQYLPMFISEQYDESALFLDQLNLSR